MKMDEWRNGAFSVKIPFWKYKSSLQLEKLTFLGVKAPFLGVNAPFHAVKAPFL